MQNKINTTEYIKKIILSNFNSKWEKKLDKIILVHLGNSLSLIA